MALPMFGVVASVLLLAILGVGLWNLIGKAPETLATEPTTTMSAIQPTTPPAAPLTIRDVDTAEATLPSTIAMALPPTLPGTPSPNAATLPAPVVITVPDGVSLRKVDLALELQILSFYQEHRDLQR